LSTDVRQIEQAFPGYIGEVEKNYRWNFTVIALDSSFFSFALGMLSHDTIMPFFASQLTGSKFLISLVPALYYLGLFFPQLIGAYLVNGRPTRKWAIFWIAATERLGILFIALIAQFLGLLSSTQALVLLFAAYLLFTVTNGLIGPAYADFISKNIIRRRGLFYGLMNGLGNLFGFAAGLTAAYLLDRYSFPLNLQYLFWIGFASSFISPFLIASFREVPFPVTRRVESLREFLRVIPGYVRESPAFRNFMLARAVMGVGIIGNAFYALYSLERYNLTEGYLGIFTLTILLSQSFLGLLWGWTGDRFGFKMVFVLASAIVAAMGLLALLAPGLWAFYIIAAGIGGVYAAMRTGDPNMVFEIAPPAETSRFVGISNTFLGPVMTISALVGGLIVDAFSYQALFAIVLVVGVVATALTILRMPDTRVASG
jgi:MFS family permease